HLHEVFPRSPPVGSAALHRNRSASRAPLPTTPVHHDPDVFLARKGPSKSLLEIGMGLLDDDVHRPVPGICTDAHEDGGKRFHHVRPESPSCASTRHGPPALSRVLDKCSASRTGFSALKARITMALLRRRFSLIGSSGRPNAWYSKPRAFMRAGSSRLRASSTSGRAMTSWIRSQSSRRNSSHSVVIRSASASFATSYGSR